MGFLAGDHPIEVAIGAGFVDNVPFTVPKELELGVVAHHDRFGLWGGFQRYFDKKDWYWAPTVGYDAIRHHPLIQVDATLSAGMELVPVQGTVDGWPGSFALALRAGFGLVQTSDDLELLQCWGQADCEVTRDQILPELTYGGRLIVSPIPAVNLSLRFETFQWIDVVDSTTLVRESDRLFAADVGVRFGR